MFLGASGLKQAALAFLVLITASAALVSCGTTISITLPGFSESVVVAPDNLTGFAAVPTAPVTPGTVEPPGMVEMLDLSSDVITSGIPVPGARYLAQSHNGNRLLVLGSR